MSVIRCVRSKIFPPFLYFGMYLMLMNPTRSSYLLNFVCRLYPDCFLYSLERYFLGMATNLIILDCWACLHCILVQRDEVCLRLLLVYTSIHPGMTGGEFSSWSCGTHLGLWTIGYVREGVYFLPACPKYRRVLYLFPCSHLRGISNLASHCRPSFW